MPAERSDETIFTAVARLRQRSERLRALAPEAEPGEPLDQDLEPDAAVGAEPASEERIEPADAPQRPAELVWPAEPKCAPYPLTIPADDAFAQADPEPEPELESESETELAADFEPAPEPAPLFEPDAEHDPAPRFEAEPEPEDAFESGDRLAPESEPEAEIQPELEPELEPETAYGFDSESEPEPALEVSLGLDLEADPEPSPALSPASEAESEPDRPATPLKRAAPSESPEPAIFADAAEVVDNDLAQPPADEPATAEAPAPDPEVEAAQEKALAGLVDPEERERLVERYAPVVDLQRLPKSRPQRVLTKARKLAEEAAKPKPKTAPHAPSSRPGSPPAAGAPAQDAASSAGQSEPGIDFAAHLAGGTPEGAPGDAKALSPDSGDKSKPKKKRVSLLDSYFKGL